MKAWYVAKNDLKIIIRDIPGLIFLFVTPILVITIASFALSGLFNKSQNIFTIPIVVKDDGYQARIFLNELEKIDAISLEKYYEEDGRRYAMTTKMANQLIPKRKAAIIIPEDFSDNFSAGKETKIIVLKDPADRVVPSVIRDIVTKVISQFNSKRLGVDVASATLEAFNNEELIKRQINIDYRPYIAYAGKLTDELIDDPVIDVEDKAAVEDSSVHKATPFESNVPGYAVMFILFGTTFAAGTLLAEKEDGTLKRLVVAPISKMSILGGKLMSNFLQALAQALILFSIGHWIFGMWLGRDIIALVLLIFATAFAATGLGILLAAFCKTKSQVRGIAVMVVLVNSALGGSWWPLYIVPETMQKIGHITLTAWAMDGFNNLLIYGKTLESITLSLFVLIGMGTIFFSLAIGKFRMDDY